MVAEGKYLPRRMTRVSQEIQKKASYHQGKDSKRQCKQVGIEIIFAYPIVIKNECR